MRRIVSIPVYRCELSAIDLCLNYRCVGDIDAVVLHVNALADFHIERLAAIVDRLPPLRGRVLINPRRVPIPQMRSHPRHVGVLHRAHVANFAFASATLDFDIFCLDASNSLLVLPGLKDYVRAGRTGSLGPHRWRGFGWHGQSLADPIWTLLGDDWWQCNPEGTFYSRQAFAAIAREVETYEALLAAQPAPPCDFPREEYLFPSLHAKLHGAQDLVPPYVFLRWATNLSWPPEQVREILESGQILDHYQPRYGALGIKRVGYGAADWLRAMVGEAYGYRAWTLEAAAMWAA